MTGLTIRRLASLKYKLFVTSVAVFALVAQPLYGAISASVVNALSTVHTTNLQDWDLTESRATGHSQLVAGGLRVWTDGKDNVGPRTDGVPGTWGTDKAAGYYATPGLKLGDVNSASIEFATTEGGEPGLQLVVDRDNDSIPDGYLVYEPAFYGEGIWWTKGLGFNVPAGSGYESMGTLAQYQAANPLAKVQAIGYSLGSGVKGDVIISKMTFGETSYTFDLAPLAAPTNLKPATGTATNNPAFPMTWNSVAGATKYEYRASYSQVNATTLGNEIYSDASESSANYTLGASTITRTNSGTPAADYFWQVRAGNSVQWSDWSTIAKVVVEYTAPTVSAKADSKQLTSATPTDPIILLPGKSTVFQADVADGQSGAYGATIELFKANSDGSYGTWVKDNTNGTGNVRYGTQPKLVYDTSSLNGKYGLKIVAQDNAGNSVTQYKFFTIDSEAPAPAPVLSLKTAQGIAIASGGYTNKSEVAASWTKPSGDIAKYEYAYWNNIAASRYNTEEKAWTTELSDMTRSGTFDQGEGKHYMKVRAFDPAGNASNWSNIFEVTYDKTLPTDLAIKLADGRSAQDTTIGGEQTFTLTQAEANPKSIYIEYMEKNSNGNWSKKLGKEVLGTNSAALTVDTSTWSDGIHQVKVTAKDAAGNAASAVTQFTVDNTPPSITVKDGFKGNKAEHVFREVSFSLYDAHMVDKHIINQHESDFANNNWSDANFQNIKQYLVQGKNEIVLYDVAGNSSSYEFFYDTQAATALFAHSNNNDNTLVNSDVTSTLTSSEPIQSPSGWTLVENSNKQKFTKISAQNNKENITIIDMAGNSSIVFFEVKRIDKTKPTFNIVNDTNFTTSSVEVIVNEENISKITVNGAAVSFSATKPNYKVTVTGEDAYIVVATDKAGNESTVRFTINTPPVAPTIGSFMANGISGAGEPGSTIKLSLGDVPVVTVLPITVAEDGSWSYVFTPTLIAGSYNVSAIATDGGGSSSAATRSLTVATPPSPVLPTPVAPVGAPQGSGDTNDPTENASTPISTLLPAASLFSAATPLLAPGTTPAATDDNDNTIASVQGLSTANSNESDDTEGEVKAAEDTKASWSLGNLVLTAISVIAGLMALLGVFRKRETDEITHTALRAVVIVVAAGTAIAYVLTNDFSAPMAWFSMWSIAYAVAVIAQVSIIANLKGSAE